MGEGTPMLYFLNILLIRTDSCSTENIAEALISQLYTCCGSFGLCLDYMLLEIKSPLGLDFYFCILHVFFCYMFLAPCIHRLQALTDLPTHQHLGLFTHSTTQMYYHLYASQKLTRAFHYNTRTFRTF